MTDTEAAAHHAAAVGPGSWTSRLRHRFRAGAFARNVAVLTGGTMAGQLLLVAASPVVTRLFSPAEFGLLAVYASLLTIALAFSALRYDMAVPVARSHTGALNLLAVCASITLAMTAALAAAVAFGAGPLLRMVNAQALVPYAWLLPAGFLAGGAYLALSAWAVRRGAYPVLARTRISQSVGQAGLQIGGGVLGLGSVALLLGDLVGRAAGAGSLLLLVLREPRLAGRVSWARMRAMARRYRRFPQISCPSTALNSAGLRLPALFLIAWYGPAVAGWFALGQRVVALPLTWVGHSVAQVYFSETARLARDDPQRLGSLFRAATRRLLLVGAPPLVLGGLAAPWVFGPVFGDQWPQAGRYVMLLTPMLVAQFVVSPVSQVLYAIERQSVQFWWDAARFAVVVGVFSAARLAGWSGDATVAAYSLSMCAMYVVLYVLYARVVGQFVRQARSRARVAAT